jgi:hypothetical protein
MSKRSRIQAREELSAAPKHLHMITMTREIFSSKICTGGGGRREIKWGEREAAPSTLVRRGVVKKMRGEKVTTPIYTQEKLILPVGGHQYYW